MTQNWTTHVYTDNSEQTVRAPEIEDSEHDNYADDADRLDLPPLKVPWLGVRCRGSKGKTQKYLIAKYSWLVPDKDGNGCFSKLCKEHCPSNAGLVLPQSSQQLWSEVSAQ